MAKLPAATFNTSGFGPLIPNAAPSPPSTESKPYVILPPNIKPSSGTPPIGTPPGFQGGKPLPPMQHPTRQPPAQTSSPKANLHPQQFGKHRATTNNSTGNPPSYQKQSGRGYQGKRSSLGKHANMGSAATSAVNATQGYQGAHAKGAHAKSNAVTPKNVTKVTGVSQGNKKPYVPKHTPQGQAQRAQAQAQKAQAVKKNQRNKAINKNINKVRAVHRFTRSLPKGPAIHEILASMKTSV